MEKWLNHVFSSGVETGKDYITFQKAAKADLRKQAKAAGYTLHKFYPNHYTFSAVLHEETTDKFIYISIRDVRGGRNEWYNCVLYRTMTHDHDWTGSFNQYCCWSEISQALEQLKTTK